MSTRGAKGSAPPSFKELLQSGQLVGLGGLAVEEASAGVTGKEAGKGGHRGKRAVWCQRRRKTTEKEKDERKGSTGSPGLW